MKRRLFTMVLALLLAGAGTALVFLYARGADRRALAGQRAVDVLVAARTIPAGTPAGDLTARGWVRTVRMPAGTLPGDALSSVDAGLADRVIGAGVPAGELIRRPLLVPKGGTGFAVPDGKLAVTVALTDPRRVGGHLAAGDKVTVFASYKLVDGAGRVRNDATGARLLMSGVDVLSAAPAATGGTAQNTTTGGSGTPGLVTLAVTQQEAEKLIWAANGSSGNQDGGLYLALQTDTTTIDPNDPGVSSFTLGK